MRKFVPTVSISQHQPFMYDDVGILTRPSPHVITRLPGFEVTLSPAIRKCLKLAVVIELRPQNLVIYEWHKFRGVDISLDVEAFVELEKLVEIRTGVWVEATRLIPYVHSVAGSVSGSSIRGIPWATQDSEPISAVSSSSRPTTTTIDPPAKSIGVHYCSVCMKHGHC